jgi:hypothetical protein
VLDGEYSIIKKRLPGASSRQAGAVAAMYAATRPESRGRKRRDHGTSNQNMLHIPYRTA